MTCRPFWADIEPALFSLQLQLTAVRGVPQGWSLPLRGAFLFCQNAEGAASGEDFIWFAPPPQTKTKQAPRHHAEVPGGLFLQ